KLGSWSGWYLPIVSIALPLRRARESAMMIRYWGWRILPSRCSLILTATGGGTPQALVAPGRARRTAWGHDRCAQVSGRHGTARGTGNGGQPSILPDEGVATPIAPCPRPAFGGPESVTRRGLSARCPGTSGGCRRRARSC